MLSRRNVYSLVMVLVGLGMVIFLLPGCGSNSNSGAVGAKKEKAVKSGAKNSQVAIPFMTVNEGALSPAINKAPETRDVEVFPGITQAELDAKVAAARKKVAESKGEVLPGITQEELDANKEKARKGHAVSQAEVLPGITQRQLDAKLAAQQQVQSAPHSEVLPGISQQDLDAKLRLHRQLVREEGERGPLPAGK